MQLNQRTESRLGRLIDTCYYLLIIVAFYLFMRYAFWLVFPFLFSFFVAAVLQKPMNFALKKFRMKKSFTSVVLVLLFYALIVMVIVLIGARLWNGAKEFTAFLTAQLQNLPKLIGGLTQRLQEMAQRLPDGVEVRFNEWLTDFTGKLLAGENAKGETVGLVNGLISRINLEWFKTPMNGVLNVAGQIPTLVVAVLITVVSSFFMTTGYDELVGFIKRQLPARQRSAMSATKRILFSSLGKLLRSYVIIMFVTFIELTLGLLLLRLIGVFDGKYLIAIALITALVDILPALGVVTVLLPWVLYSLIMGNVGLGVGLLVLLAMITVVRQILEPKLIASNLGLPPIATLAGMYIGLQVFGFIGMFIIPILLILLKLLNDEGVVRIWKPAPPKPEKQAPGNSFSFEKMFRRKKK